MRCETCQQGSKSIVCGLVAHSTVRLSRTLKSRMRRRRADVDIVMIRAVYSGGLVYVDRGEGA